jgi:hypothetical protein
MNNQERLQQTMSAYDQLGDEKPDIVLVTPAHADTGNCAPDCSPSCGPACAPTDPNCTPTSGCNPLK